MPSLELRVEPFLLLRWGGIEAECVVTFNAQAVGVSSGGRGIVSENATHVVTVFDHLDGLETGNLVQIESAFTGASTYTVLDIDPLPFGVLLYTRREDRTMVDP